MPQIQRERPAAEPLQGCAGKRAVEQRPGRQQAHHEHAREDCGEQHAAVIEELRGRGHNHHDDDEAHQAHPAKDLDGGGGGKHGAIDKAARRGGVGDAAHAHLLHEQVATNHGHVAQGPHERQQGACQHGKGARIAAVVHAARVGSRHVEHRHEHGGDEGEDACDNGHGALVVVRKLETHRENERPQDAKLHVNAQIPQVRERRDAADLVEVRQAVHDVVPVVEEQKARQDVGAHLGEGHVVEGDAGHTDNEDHRRHGRPESLEAAAPEARQIHVARAVELAQDGVGHQVARQHEEHDDAHMAAWQPVHLQVVCHHGCDCQGAQTLD